MSLPIESDTINPSSTVTRPTQFPTNIVDLHPVLNVQRSALVW